MAYVIAEACIDEMDQSCVAVCPVDCIHFIEGVDRKAYIDPGECIDCSACLPECPVNAIFAAEDVPDASLVHVDLNARWYSEPEAVRATIEALSPR